jgi:hypothetical protein
VLLKQTEPSVFETAANGTINTLFIIRLHEVLSKLNSAEVSQLIELTLTVVADQ